MGYWFSINLLFASSGSNQGDIEITGSQSDLIKIDENQSPVSEGFQYYKPPKRTSSKRKTTEPKGKTGRLVSAVSRIGLEPSLQKEVNDSFRFPITNHVCLARKRLFPALLLDFLLRLGCFHHPLMKMKEISCRRQVEGKRQMSFVTIFGSIFVLLYSCPRWRKIDLA